MVTGSVMPSYAYLLNDETRWNAIPPRLKVANQLGAPYSDEILADPVTHAKAQAAKIVDELIAQDQTLANEKDSLQEKQVIALIAYLQRVGVDLTAPPESEEAAPAAEPEAAATEEATADTGTESDTVTLSATSLSDTLAIRGDAR